MCTYRQYRLYRLCRHKHSHTPVPPTNYAYTHSPPPHTHTRTPNDINAYTHNPPPHTLSAPMSATDAGRLPTKLLPVSRMSSKLVSFPRAVGILPSNPLPARLMVLRPGRRESVVMIGSSLPVMLRLLDTSNTFRDLEMTTREGKGPDSSHPFAYISSSILSWA